jgi:hypothetical protein
LMDVMTMRQKPSRLEEVLSIWGDFLVLMLRTVCVYFITNTVEQFDLLVL